MSLFFCTLPLLKTAVVESTVLLKDEKKVDETFAGRGVLLVKMYWVLNSVYIKWWKIHDHLRDKLFISSTINTIIFYVNIYKNIFKNMLELLKKII